MTDPRRPMDTSDDWTGIEVDRQFHGDLRELGERLDFPPTPDLARAVRARLEAEAVAAVRAERPGAAAPIPIDRPRPARFRFRRSTLLAIAAMLVLAAVVAAAAYIVLGGGVRLSFVNQVPTAPPRVTLSPTVSPGQRSPTVSPSPLPVGALLGLGEIVPLDGVAARVGFTPLAPPSLPALGPPDAVYVDPDVPTSGGMISYVYAARPGFPETEPGQGVGLVITQFRGDLARGEYFQKLASTDTTVTRTTIHDRTGYFVSGPKHAFLYHVPGGDGPTDERFRLVGNALIWERGPLTLRLEGDLTLEQARHVAESID